MRQESDGKASLAANSLRPQARSPSKMSFNHTSACSVAVKGHHTAVGLSVEVVVTTAYQPDCG